ncbi:MAG TPA: UDP-N-acetylmuramoyl-L-alanine--D-glutamate ligase [Candidatus Polarisedimenticolaceae bacterium]|nr:UDP-N-acetylmuramoyl-L-alanine--D-glutamate ligase [Candidatus Polarisedimenticolaceae bacterium]
MPISIGTDTPVAVFGFGVEGRAAASWLKGVRPLFVIAKERPADLPPGASFAPDTDSSVLDRIDLLVRSPGIPAHHPLLIEAARRGTRVTTGTSLFVEALRHAGIPIVGVTGSKGKSTTSTLIHLVLDEAGIDNVLVGNIGRAALSVLDDVLAKRPIVIYEMSSYQTHDLSIGPNFAVLTRLFPEHLDWHGSKESYYASKLNIARCQTVSDTTIWNATDPELSARAPFGLAHHVPYGTEDAIHFARGAFRRGAEVLFDDRTMKLRGLHNRLNACAALTVAETLGASAGDLRAVLETFAGLPHRLEDVGLHDGIRWINDSISTAPEAAVAALEALGGEVATYIGGGADRGFDFTPLARALASLHVPNVILVPPGGPRMAEAMEGPVRLVRDLAEAVGVARSVTPAGKTVLFSPASPSYGTYVNFEERGEHFRQLVVTAPRKSR